jgi:hypothetical protein
MKSDALQVFVRGFETKENGDKIVRVLQGYGFEIKEKFDSSADTFGGLIETYITPVDHLDCADPHRLGQAARRVAGEQTFIQYEYWDRVWGGDSRQPNLKLRHEAKGGEE